MMLNQEGLWKSLTRPIDKIGIDIDTHDFKTYRAVIKRCEQFGSVTESKTKHGWHFAVKFPQTETLIRSFEIRYYCHDDYHRLVRDMMKAMHGFKVIDVLFDRKEVLRKSVLEL